MQTLHHLSDALNVFERRGQLNVRIEDMEGALPGTSSEGLRKALYRQQQRGRVLHLSRGVDHWLIVPLQHTHAGAPPLETWLDPYLRKTLQTPYYVGLLSAAETYGVSPYGVMVTQVMVTQKRRPIRVGRHEVMFHTRVRLEQMPTRWHETADGRFKISAPELTALELIQRENTLGGIARVQAVLQGLWAHCTVEGLTEALMAVDSLPPAQRLGALMTLDGQSTLIKPVTDWLRNQPTRLISLDGSLLPEDAPRLSVDTTFKVFIPSHTSQSANT